MRAFGFGIYKSGRSRERSLFFFANVQKAVSFVISYSVETVSKPALLLAAFRYGQVVDENRQTKFIQTHISVSW